MFRFHIYAYDVWGNSRDGFQVNNQIFVGTAKSEIALKDISDKDVLKIFRQFFNGPLEIDISGDFGDDRIEIVDPRNEKPIGYILQKFRNEYL